MTKENLLSLITNASTVVVTLLGKTFNIKGWKNGFYSIEDKNSNSFTIYSSAQDLIDNYEVMGMPLNQITSWMCVTAVA